MGQPEQIKKISLIARHSNQTIVELMIPDLAQRQAKAEQEIPHHLGMAAPVEQDQDRVQENQELSTLHPSRDRAIPANLGQA